MAEEKIDTPSFVETKCINIKIKRMIKTTLFSICSLKVVFDFSYLRKLLQFVRGKSLLESLSFPTDSYALSLSDLSQTSCTCALIVWIVLI